MDNRTLDQNAALHTWFRDIAEVFCDNGWTVDYILTHHAKAEIPWDEDLVKKIIYHKVMKAMTGKDSTAKLDKKELSEVVEYVTMWMNKELGVNVPFGRGNV